MPSELRKVILAVRTTGIHRSTAWTASSAVNMTRSALTLHLAFLPLRADLSIREAVELLSGVLNCAGISAPRIGHLGGGLRIWAETRSMASEGLQRPRGRTCVWQR